MYYNCANNLAQSVRTGSIPSTQNKLWVCVHLSRSFSRCSLVLSVLFGGCTASVPVDVAKTRYVCGVPDTVYTWQATFSRDFEEVFTNVDPLGTTFEDPRSETSQRLLVPIESHCVEQLISDFNMVWPTEYAAVSNVGYDYDLQPTTKLTHYVTGLHSLLMMDLGRVDSVFESENVPDSFERDMRRFVRRGWINEDDELSSAIYIWLADKIKTVRLGANEFSSSHTVFDDDNRAVIISPDDFSIDHIGHSSGLLQTLELVHEAGHYYGSHDDDGCGGFIEKGFFCDDDDEMAYGVHGWFSSRILLSRIDYMVRFYDEWDSLHDYAHSGSSIVYDDRFLSWVEFAPMLEPPCERVGDLSDMSYCLNDNLVKIGQLSYRDRVDE